MSLGALAFAAGLLLTAASAHAAAAQGIDFDLQRGPGAERCPDRETLAKRVAKHVGPGEARAEVPERVAGKTYANDCERQRVGMSKLANGACGATTGSDGGVTSSLSLSPPSASFSTGIVLTSEPVTFVVTNQGPGASGDLNLRITGASPQQFVVSNSTCVAFLPAGQTCQVLIAFKAPSTPGTYSATMSINESGGAVLTAPLSGYAFPPPGATDGGASDAATGTQCPENRPTSGSECSAGPTTWCSYTETDPLNQILCNCSASRWSCSIASP
jgi:hypothetical protein